MNSTIKTLWTEHYKINSLLLNSFGRLGLYGVLNLIQETAWMHAEELGFGMKHMEQEGMIWVLTRQTLSMNEWPEFNKEIKIQTWLKQPDLAFVTREFRLLDDKDREIGLCSTSWLAIHRENRSILQAQNLRPWDEITRKESTGLVNEKIAAKGEFEKLAKFRVRNSDLDTNQHVNNTKYSQWILDSIPIELHQQLKLHTYSVNFLAETHLGDVVQIERNKESSLHHSQINGTTLYRGQRLSDDKTLFTARLTWGQR